MGAGQPLLRLPLWPAARPRLCQCSQGAGAEQGRNARMLARDGAQSREAWLRREALLRTNWPLPIAKLHA